MTFESLRIKKTAIALAVAATLGAGAYALYPIRKAEADTTPAPVTVAQAAPAAVVTPATTARFGVPDFASIVRQYGPAVVNVRVEGLQRGPNDDGSDDDNAEMPFGVPDELRQFFRQFRGPRMHPPVPVQGQGSGFIVASDGVILTNAHVVDGAKTVTVKLTDNRDFKAKVVGVDKQSDIAVLRIDAKNLPTVRIGSSADTQVGEWVLAIGAPFGFENSATAGIVSAKSRALPDENYVPFIQTDAAVNPGNSGGPLFNLNGEVIGINSQIYSRTGGYQGVSFAIPIDVAIKVKDQLVSSGKVQRGRLGLAVQQLTPDLAESLGIAKAGEPVSGALVSSVENGSPAEAAGVQPGDVIVAFDGKPVRTSSDLPLLVADAKPGARATLTIQRQGKQQDLAVKVGEQKPDKVARAGDGGKADQPRLGVAVRPLTKEERAESKLATGVVVEEVGGPAAAAGIQPGDVILSVNGVAVKDVASLKAAVAKAGKRAALLVQREDARIFVPVDLG